jgi:tetratricopeptide (TPR) repeat protein
MKPVQLFRSFLLFTLLGSLHAVNAQGITVPRIPSPQASVSQTIGISTVYVEYSRPAVKGRTIWGELVPYGWNVQNFGNQNSAPWRAGANENTVIKFSHDAMVEGKPVPAGKYGLFFTINADNTGEVILSKDYRSWGSFFYEPDRDQARASIQLRSIPMTELLTYDFINVTKNTAELVLNWEQKQFPVRIEFNTDAIVMKNAAEELKGVTGFNWQGFSTAANYALQNKVNIEEAVGWADQAVAANKNFNTLIVKSSLLRHQGNKDEAAKMESEALAMGNEAEINTYGYQLLGQGFHDEAIRIFILNTERYPESANTWDSLGEGYAIKGDKANAVKNFKKSLSLNPNEGTKANSIKYLKQLGEM